MAESTQQYNNYSQQRGIKYCWNHFQHYLFQLMNEKHIDRQYKSACTVEVKNTSPPLTYFPSIV